MLVDTGKVSADDELIRGLEILSNSKHPLKYLFLTHSHCDHYLNAAKLKDKFQCKI
ncbi:MULTISPECIES: MBL fold metallo-hydrolase [unclassified Lentimicrobium]|uniref:MBL fold metallo-hydrolase n=1 Tax=unclassified Lentimicrobium TaxID=2677434 RepID=UPI001553136D|nr:MBL fold metallo-hydrolase [Lentimicrobium sp. S6]NPD84074.1 MBL fold metallo-hydrolase [Lentimicrobium sp. L6]